MHSIEKTLPPPESSDVRETTHSEGEAGYKGPAAAANAGAVLGKRAVIHAGKLIHFLLLISTFFFSLCPHAANGFEKSR